MFSISHRYARFVNGQTSLTAMPQRESIFGCFNPGHLILLKLGEELPIEET